jgi:SAM-dependent methyltransferase
MTIKQSFAKFKYRLGDKLRREGLMSALHYGWGCIAWELCKLNPVFRQRWQEDQNFDALHGCDTSGIVTFDQLTILQPQKQLSYHYATLQPWLVRDFIGRIGEELSQFHFVDLGSGKGRILLIAAQYPFKLVIGVELTPELDAIAKKNIATANITKRCQSIISHCADASTFAFPDGPLVMTMYNPFNATVVERVLKNLIISLKQQDRLLYIVYINPRHKEVLEANPLFKQMCRTRKYVIYQHRPKET